MAGLDTKMRLWDATNGEFLNEFVGHSQTAWEMRFFSDGKTIVSIGEDCTIRFWNVEQQKEIGGIWGHPGAIWSMALSPDQKSLATGGSNGVIRIWDLATGKVKRTFETTYTGGVWPLVYSPDGKTLVSGGWQDNKVFIFEVSTGKKRLQLPVNSGSKSFVFTPDGRTLITASNEQNIFFWDARNYQLLSRLQAHTQTINAVALSPDGKWLASAGTDGKLQLWNLSAWETPSLPPNPLPDRVWEVQWNELSSPDAENAFYAMKGLTSDPIQTLKQMKERLHPSEVASGEKIKTLVMELGNPKFALRERANNELGKMGEPAVPYLIEGANYSQSAEVRRRSERLLEEITSQGPAGKDLQEIRAIEVLERIGAPNAMALLESLTKEGDPKNRLTVEAKAAWNRLSKSTISVAHNSQ